MIHFFGPPDTESKHSDQLMRWKVKMASNDDMRNQFLSTYVPKVREVGLDFPDPNLKKNEDGTWSFSDPDWDEFWQVIKGNGPCNKERLSVSAWAEEHGRWVRAALKNPANKHTVPAA